MRVEASAGEVLEAEVEVGRFWRVSMFVRMRASVSLRAWIWWAWWRAMARWRGLEADGFFCDGVVFGSGVGLGVREDAAACVEGIEVFRIDFGGVEVSAMIAVVVAIVSSNGGGCLSR